MVARGALWNASIFSAKGKLPWEDVKRAYVRKVSFLRPTLFFLSNVFRCSLLSAYLKMVLIFVGQSILWDNDLKSTKQTLKEMIMHYSCLELAEGKAVIKAENLGDLA
jgi:tRNA-dihydrouridine synthase 2